MKALGYHGPGKKAWEEKAKPTIKIPTDAIVKVVKTTICGTDLHIMKGDVPEVTDGRIIAVVQEYYDHDPAGGAVTTPILFKMVQSRKIDLKG